jgi:hypothetical protein
MTLNDVAALLPEKLRQSPETAGQGRSPDGQPLDGNRRIELRAETDSGAISPPHENETAFDRRHSVE